MNLITFSIIGGSLAGGIIIGRQIDSGIANLLALQTLRHGTNAFSYLGIRLFGGQPKMGDSSVGSAYGAPEDNLNPCKGYFYVTADSEYYVSADSELGSKLSFIPSFIIHAIGKRIFTPHLHSSMSGSNTAATIMGLEPNAYEKNYSPPINFLRTLLKTVGGVITPLLVPIVRFRFTEIDQNRFEDDTDYNFDGDFIAYKTPQKIEAWRTGSWGALLIGVNAGWWSRAKEHPWKVLGGAATIITALALMSPILYFALTSNYNYLFFVAPLGAGVAISLI